MGTPDLIKRVQEEFRDEIKALSGERQEIQDSAQQIHELLQLQHKKQEAKVAADLAQRKAAAATLQGIREASEKVQQQAQAQAKPTYAQATRALPGPTP